MNSVSYSNIQKNAHASLLRKSVVTCAFFVFACIVFSPSVVRAEYIESFVTDIAVTKDSSFTVTETIEYVFTEEKHGIFRCVPTKHNEPASSLFKERYIEVVFDPVILDGSAVSSSLYHEGNSLCIKIGEESKTITGPHTYVIAYTVEGAISYLEFGGADLYWNVTGTEWGVPMKSVTANVVSPDGLLRQERSCYLGTGETSLSCSVSDLPDGTVTFSGRNLDPYEGMTISQALNRNAIAEDIRERYNRLIFAVVGGIISLVILAYYIYRHRTAYDTDNAIIPQYEPYPNIQPMDMGVLFDGTLHARDVSAGFVYLAQQGYIRIRNTQKKVLFLFEVDDYEITLLKLPDEKASPFVQELLSLFFGTSPLVGTHVSLSDIKKDTKRIAENANQLKKIEVAITASLLEHGFYTGGDLVSFIKRPVVVLAILIGVACTLVLKVSVLFLVAGVCVAFVALSAPRRTTLGYEAKEYLQGFKDFLSVTESQRYIFHNAPEKNAEHFMEFLPYAIAFGVEKQWVKAFEGIAIPAPSWYEDSRGMNSFAPLAFTESLSGFSDSLASSTTQSSSSGGGSVGGGAGGGGGGSW